MLQGFEDHGSKEWRKAQLLVSTARSTLAVVVQKTVRHEQLDSQTREESHNPPYFLGLKDATFLPLFATWLTKGVPKTRIHSLLWRMLPFLVVAFRPSIRAGQ